VKRTARACRYDLSHRGKGISGHSTRDKPEKEEV
jgi:hypothetical protein